MDVGVTIVNQRHQHPGRLELLEGFIDLRLRPSAVFFGSHFTWPGPFNERGQSLLVLWKQRSQRPFFASFPAENGVSLPTR